MIFWFFTISLCPCIRLFSHKSLGQDPFHYLYWPWFNEWPGLPVWADCNRSYIHVNVSQSCVTFPLCLVSQWKDFKWKLQIFVLLWTFALFQKLAGRSQINHNSNRSSNYKLRKISHWDMNNIYLNVLPASNGQYFIPNYFEQICMV